LRQHSHCVTDLIGWQRKQRDICPLGKLRGLDDRVDFALEPADGKVGEGLGAGLGVEPDDRDRGGPKQVGRIEPGEGCEAGYGHGAVQHKGV
jgi:hypothetical protein